MFDVKDDKKETLFDAHLFVCLLRVTRVARLWVWHFSLCKKMPVYLIYILLSPRNKLNFLNLIIYVQILEVQKKFGWVLFKWGLRYMLIEIG